VRPQPPLGVGVDFLQALAAVFLHAVEPAVDVDARAGAGDVQEQVHRLAALLV
jgi:hypothetical protein